MAGKEPVYGIREISLRGAQRTREEWLKGREENQLVEIDLSKYAKDGKHCAMLIDFTQSVIGLVYEMPATEANAEAPMLQQAPDWREVNEPVDVSHDEWKRKWEEAQKKKAGEVAPEPKPETAPQA